jgi:hypothetical protein
METCIGFACGILVGIVVFAWCGVHRTLARFGRLATTLKLGEVFVLEMSFGRHSTDDGDGNGDGDDDPQVLEGSRQNWREN